MTAKEMIIKSIGKVSDRRVVKYGKINDNLAYEITSVNHNYYDYSNEHTSIVFIENVNGKLEYRNDLTKIFYPETESTGGRFAGKQYKTDLELALGYIDSLKTNQ